MGLFVNIAFINQLSGWLINISTPVIIIEFYIKNIY